MTPALLDEKTVVAYLQERGILSLRAQPTVRILTGGVSNVVLAVSGEGKELVLKQALPALKVKATWVVEQRRALVEAKAIAVLSPITPLNVPQLYDIDADRFVLVIERIPDTTNWKEDLLEGVIRPEIAASLGTILGTWHQTTSRNPSILIEFQEDSLFEQLRINPFYRSLVIAHPPVAPRITQLIEELEGSKTSLVHGDFSPKNMLVAGDGHPIVLDFETAHTGNPVFDLAFLLGHLVCKQEYFQHSHEKNSLAVCATVFLDAYQESLGAAADPHLSWHVATIALARIDGVSPVNYLNQQGQQSVRDRALAILRAPTAPTISEVFLQS